MVVALILTSVNFVCVENAEAKSTVKSIKVKGAKKSFTMQVGAKKVFKVKVKAPKRKMGFKVKSSSKKVVSVKKKGKKIVLTAKKQGKAKIVVRSKFNKKKKYVMTVVVKNKEQAPTVKPKAKLVLNAESADSTTFFLRFSEKVSISKNDILVQKLITKNGNEKYENVKEFIGIDTDDNKSYIAAVDDELIVPGVKVKFTVSVNGEKIEAECQTTDDTKPTTFNEIFVEEKDEEFLEYVYTAGEKNAKLLSFEGLPEGIAYNFIPTKRRIEIEGTFSNKGLYETVAKIEDENGIINTYKIVFLVGEENTLYAYCDDQIDYVYNGENETMKAEGEFDIYVSGGSYSYGYKLLEGSDDCFKVDNDVEYYSDEHYYDCYPSLYYENVDKPGVYTANVEIFDYNNKKTKTVVNCTLTVKSLNKLSGKVTDGNGRPISNANAFTYSINNDDSFENICWSDKNGNYEMFVSPGTHIIEAFYNDVYYLKQKQISSDTKLNLLIKDLFRVKISYNNYFVMGNPEYWFVDDGSYQTFEQFKEYRFDLDSYRSEDVETIYLPKGHHKLKTCGIAYKDGKMCLYSAAMEIDVNGDMNTVAYIQKEKDESAWEIKLNEIRKVEGLSNVGNAFRFTPTEDGEYEFYSYNFTSDDPYAELLGEDFYAFNDDKGENNLNFSLKVNLEAGKTYYLHYNAYDYAYLLFEGGNISVKKVS